MNYGKHLDELVRALRSGPFSDMRCATQLTADDLRAGAARMEREAAARRTLADRIEGRVVTASWASQQVKDLMRHA